MGASQTNIWTKLLGNMLSPGAVDTRKNGLKFDGVFTLLIDVIVEDGKVLYHNIVRDPRATNHSEAARIGAHSSERDGRVLSQVFKSINKGVKFTSKRIRFTNFFGEYWDDLPIAINAMRSMTSDWKEAPIGLVAAIGLWYTNSFRCAQNAAWCATRPEVDTYKMPELLDSYRRGAQEVLPTLERFCSPGDRAGKLGCVISSIDHCQYMNGEIWHLMRDIMEHVMAGHITNTFRYVDLWTYTLQIPEDCLIGHQSPFSGILTWQLFLGGFCAARGRPSSNGTMMSFEGETCRAHSIVEKCHNYKSLGFNFLWECDLGKPCVLRTHHAPKDLNAQRDPKTIAHIQLDFEVASKVPPLAHSVADSLWSTISWISIVVLIVGGLAVVASEVFVDVPPVLQKSLPWMDKLGYTRMVHHNYVSDAIVDIRPYTANALSKNTQDYGRCTQTTSSASSTTSHSHKLLLPDRAFLPLDNHYQEDELQLAEARIMVSNHSPLGGKGPPRAAKETSGKVPVKETQNSPERFPFGLSRFLASLHVVAGHMYARQAIIDFYLFDWGFTWVPWFFMLSGFTLFSAESMRPRRESIPSYVARRAASIIPLYAVALPVAAAFAKFRGELPTLRVLLLESWLLQAWTPTETEQCLQMQCWFLSCLVLYWALFRPLHRAISSIQHWATALGILLFIFLLPWLVIIIPAHMGDLNWADRHAFGDNERTLDLVVVTLKFNPICYCHVFVVGMLLARFRELAAAWGEKAWVIITMHLLAPVAYLLLLAIFLVPVLRPPAPKLSARLSILLPLQSAILLGLAGLPRASKPILGSLAMKVNFLEKYSYAIYVMQFVCYHLWPCTTVNILFFLFLGLVAVLTVHTVQKPVEKALAKSPHLVWLFPIGLTIFLTALWMIPEVKMHGEIADHIELEDMVVDIRLPLSSQLTQGRLINPSILFRDDGNEMVMTARRHRRTSRRLSEVRDGKQVSVVEDVWHSQILIGSKSIDPLEWDAWIRGGSGAKGAMQMPELKPWSGLTTPADMHWNELCLREKWIPQNKTWLRLIVTGPEDSRVFQRFPTIGGPGVDVAFNSYPPLGRTGCAKGEAVSQMYLAEGIDPASPRTPTFGYHLSCGEEDRPEKNWIPFEHKGRLFLVYSIQPHVVVEAHQDGRCSKRHYSSFAPLVSLQAKFPSVAIRGSTQAILVGDPEATPRLRKPHYLALIHLVDVHTNQYAHFAYRFDYKAPFSVLQVSSQLPLFAGRPDGASDKGFAFASGLAIRNEQVVITYAAGDSDARALVMPLQRLDVMFADMGDVKLQQ